MKNLTPKNVISKIPNNVQNRKSIAWKMLCRYIDKVAREEREEFAPYKGIGIILYSHIYTLPESISKLTKVKRMLLYGSKLKRIPPEIGKMESLEYFDPYTSYNLNWFPYEITKCKKLVDSTVSTRALFGNYKNRMGFPKLHHSPVRYFGDTVKCSECNKEMTYQETKQLWITLEVGTDYLPLLANVCSKACEDKLDGMPKPPPYYWQHPHQGGSDLQMPAITRKDYITESDKFKEWQKTMDTKKK